MLHSVHGAVSSNIHHQELLLSILLHACIFSPRFSHQLYEVFVSDIGEFLYIVLRDSHPKSNLFSIFCIGCGLFYVAKLVVSC